MEEELAVKVSREQVEENRSEVIDAAARVFREKGFDGIGIADIMEAAGLTHGGFYRHFRSKDELAAQASQRAFAQKRDELIGHLDNVSGDRFEVLVREYVSSTHRDNPGTGCSLTSLAGDAARRDDPALRTIFTDAVTSYIKLLSAVLADVPLKERRRVAISTLAEMVGAIVLSRVVADQTTAQELIDTVANDLIDRRKSAATSR
jgi:TetR/AcrR family transcriptional regulator, transcriptional repressor for nem operon